jgi:hypothetical protein
MFYIYIIYICTVSQEECARLRESVPYVKVYRYNSKHLYPKLNRYEDNGQRSLKLCQLLLTYWLPNTYWNWQEYVVSVMLISVLNIKVTCDIKPLNWTTKTLALLSYLLSLGFQVLYAGRSCAFILWRHNYRAVKHSPRALHDDVSLLDIRSERAWRHGGRWVRGPPPPPEAHTFRWPLSP